MPRVKEMQVIVPTRYQWALPVELLRKCFCLMLDVWIEDILNDVVEMLKQAANDIWILLFHN